MRSALGWAQRRLCSRIARKLTIRSRPKPVEDTRQPECLFLAQTDVREGEISPHSESAFAGGLNLLSITVSQGV
jgi:hypothetical protein